MNADLGHRAGNIRLGRVLRAALAAVLLAGSTVPAMAGPQAAYANLPTQLSPDPQMRSQAGLCKPLLVDDFVAEHGSFLHGIIWWGSAAQDERWIVALFDHEPLPPAADCEGPDPGAAPSIYADAMVTYETVAFAMEEYVPDLPGLYRYYVGTGEGPIVEIGTRYWFSVANLGPDWYWAQAQGQPTEGWKADGARALCLNGSASCGQWTDVGADLAFVIIVPEPGTVALLGAAAAALLLRRRSRHHQPAARASGAA